MSDIGLNTNPSYTKALQELESNYSTQINDAKQLEGHKNNLSLIENGKKGPGGDNRMDWIVAGDLKVMREAVAEGNVGKARELANRAAGGWSSTFNEYVDSLVAIKNAGGLDNLPSVKGLETEKKEALEGLRQDMLAQLKAGDMTNLQTPADVKAAIDMIKEKGGDPAKLTELGVALDTIFGTTYFGPQIGTPAMYDPNLSPEQNAEAQKKLDQEFKQQAIDKVMEFASNGFDVQGLSKVMERGVFLNSGKTVELATLVGKDAAGTKIDAEVINSVLNSTTGANETSTSSLVQQLQNIDLSSMDLESALMCVQMQRATILENQLKGQMEDVQRRNKDIAVLNDVMAKVRTITPGDDKGVGTLTKDELAVLKQFGVVSAKEDGKLNKTECNTLIENIKGKIDSLNATQQQDMLRLQSLTNKRNEAFEIMTNFIAKMAKARDSVIGNIR